MRVLPLFLPVLSLSLSSASPTGEQVVLGLDRARLSSHNAASTVNTLLNDATKAILRGKKNLQKWIHDGREYIKQNELLYELVSHPVFEEHQLRVTKPTALCDPSVNQISGYLDIAEDKHLFFWFFESRDSPSTDPLVLWLNGGPGCSSSTGLLFELGPCSIADDGKNTTFNPHSWNSNANMIVSSKCSLFWLFDNAFSSLTNLLTSDSRMLRTARLSTTALLLGKMSTHSLSYSSSDSPSTPSNPSISVARAMQELTQIPNIASVIWQANLQLAAAPNPSLKKINLESLLIGNGQTDPYTQMGTVAEYACSGPFPVYDDPEGPQCTALRSKVPTCQRMLQSCYKYNNKFTCVPAMLYCNSQLYGPIMQTGVNVYDVRKKCDRSKDGDLCYRELNWIESWMNEPANKVALGVDPSRNFASCNMEINQAFLFQGDGGHNSAELLTDLVNGGVRLLIYAGNADMMCNYLGNERWLEVFDSKFQSEYKAAQPIPWITHSTGQLAGSVRSAGGKGHTAGNVTFVTVFDAGHMVPFDQPEAALDLFSRWISNSPLS
ncbi:Carboxypeptidase [Mycena indigotica]|uniref:Carboxypeptidase n=1 Tax=Mycena indigotica TaxID=2126181 RepID=A0A8H6RX40_9AGAR|nr:Carboxypeptidase [Mycena indigotica]KAF7289385.1 Carboxypeptidase [Mycena indigotica]